MNPLIRTFAVMYLWLTLAAPTYSHKTIEEKPYQAPTEQQIQTAHSLFSKHFQGHFNTDLQKQWQALGYQLTRKKNIFWLKPIRKSSAHFGEFAFNLNTTSSHLLQAPHRFADRETGNIARQLFRLGGFQAVGWNSVSRYTIDLAHNTQTLMMAFTRAWQQETSKGNLIQIHGFSQDKRITTTGRHSDVIMSAGQSTMTPWLRPVAQCLKSIWPNSYCYPDEITELGGTKNVMAHQLRHSNQVHFIHLELSQDIRKQLIDDKKSVLKLNQCLLSEALPKTPYSWNKQP